MVPFDQLGEVVDTIASGAEDAFDAIGDFLSEPLFPGGSAITGLPQMMPVAQIVEEIKNGRSDDWHRGTSDARDLADAHQRTGDDIGRMLTSLRSSWTGQSADSADARIDKFRAVTNAAAERFAKNADNLSGTASGFDYLQHQLEPMPPKPPEKDFWDAVTPWDTDVEDAIGNYNAVANRNLELYSRYAADTTASAGGLNGDYGVLGAYDGKDFTMRRGPSGPHGPTGHGGSEPVVKHPGQPGPGAPGPGASAPGPAGPPVSPGSGGDGAGRVAPPTGGAGGTPVGGGHQAEESTATSSYLPPEIPDGSRSAVPPSSAPSVPTGTSTGIGFGSPVTTAAPGSTARGGANGSTGYAPGARSGGTAVESGTIGSRGAATGVRGAKGAPEGGIVPGGSRGKDDDREHHRKYGVPETDEEAEHLTDPVTGLPVMPPTIGG